MIRWLVAPNSVYTASVVIWAPPLAQYALQQAHPDSSLTVWWSIAAPLSGVVLSTNGSGFPLAFWEESVCCFQPSQSKGLVPWRRGESSEELQQRSPFPSSSQHPKTSVPRSSLIFLVTLAREGHSPLPGPRWFLILMLANL